MKTTHSQNITSIDQNGACDGCDMRGIQLVAWDHGCPQGGVVHICAQCLAETVKSNREFELQFRLHWAIRNAATEMDIKPCKD